MVSDPHDAIFKSIFERPEHARGELQSVLPGPLARSIDWTTLTHLPGSFRDHEMAAYHTDLLFSARARNGGDALIYLLLEHQSTSDRQMAFRILRYLMRIWERWRRKHGHARPLPLIVPVVFYHGERPWSARLTFESLVEAPIGLEEVVGAYVPSFRYVLDDLSPVSDDDLRRRALPALAVLAMVCLRDLRAKYVLDAMGPWSDQWAEVTQAPDAVDDARLLFHYVLRVREPDEIERFLWFLEQEVGPEAKEIMTTAAEQLIEQGIERGIRQGEVEGERKLLLKLLRQRFGSLDPETEKRIAMATREQIEAWGTGVLSAATLAEVLAA